MVKQTYRLPDGQIICAVAGLDPAALRAGDLLTDGKGLFQLVSLGLTAGQDAANGMMAVTVRPIGGDVPPVGRLRRVE